MTAVAGGRPLERIAAYAFVPVALAMALRLWHQIDEYAVDLLFIDHWDYFDALFEDRPLRQLFLWQHGPHRQGVGFLLTKALAEASGWNMRVEAFGTGAVVIAACGLALWLKRALFGRFTWSDVAIPLIVLTPLQWGVFIDTPNPAHGAVPLLLLVASGLAWTIGAAGPRTAAVCALNAALVFTGFGLVAAPITPALFAAEAVRAQRGGEARPRAWALAGFAASSATLVLFFALPYLVAPPEARAASWWEYPRFAALVLSNFVGVRDVALGAVLGALAAAAGAAALALHGWRLVTPGTRGAALSRCVVLLVGFGLLYTASLSAGRASWGAVHAGTSRYVPLVAPFFLGGYLALCAVPAGRARRLGLGLAVALLVWASGPTHAHSRRGMEFFHDAKAAWVEAYLETRSIEQANARARYAIHPDPVRSRLEEKLRFLEERHLSFFRQAPPERDGARP